MALWIPWWQTLSLMVLGLILVNGALNARTRPLLRRFRPCQRGPKVSILVPARNEARSIALCVDSLAKQTYRPLEILVLDDQSTDATPQVLVSLKRRYPHIRLLEGHPLPKGWVGKNWACHQLAQHATGDILLFVDADTWLAPDTVARMVTAMEETGAHVLSGLPFQVMGTWAERLSLPFLRFGTQGLLPSWITRWRPWPAFALAVGQFLAFRRSTYEALGGHAAVREHVVEDMALARRAVGAGYQVLFVDPRPLVGTRMYASWPEIREGFLKNLWPVIGRGGMGYLLGWLLLWSVFVLPWIGLSLTGFLDASIPGFDIQRAWTNILLAMVNWGLYGREHRRHWEPILLHPLIVTVFTYLALLSYYRHKRGRAIMWKERWIHI